jgi:hypothetical protein
MPVKRWIQLKGMSLGGSRVRPWIVAAALAAVTFARADAPTTLDGKRALGTQTYQNIEDRVKDIEALRIEAEQKGQGLRKSCIEEKLKRAKENAKAAAIAHEGMSVGGDIEYVGRQLERLFTLNVYAMVYIEEARACVTAKKAAASLEVDVDKRVTDADRDDRPSPGTPVPFGRPPLASPY